MLDLETGRESFVSLNGPLVEKSQAALARIDVAERAFNLLQAKAKADLRDDWTATRSGGAGALLIFDNTLDSIRVPYFYTRAGFERAFADRLATVADEMARDRWVLGRAGEQAMMTAQYDGLQQNLVDRYSKGFVGAWQAAISKFQMRRLTVERPNYPLLTTVASVNSPISRLLESIRDETSLEVAPRGSVAAQGIPAVGRPSASPPSHAVNQVPRIVEAALRPYRSLVEGTPGRRTIDNFISELNDIRSNLSRLATNPAQSDQIAAKLAPQITKLRADSARLPQPFARQMEIVANDVSREIADTAVARTVLDLRDKITLLCQETITSRYPFAANAEREVSAADFARMFGPNGLIQQFAKENIMPAVDVSGADWKWREETSLSKQLSATALADFQRAAEIRDIFFTGEVASPGFSAIVTPPPLIAARMDVDSVSISARPNVSSPSIIQWPLTSDAHRAAVIWEVPGRGPAILEKRGLWALHRLLDAGRASEDGSTILSVGGRDLQYRVNFSSGGRISKLFGLRSFHCPAGI
jgi:type VI secretion system protein ImpL